ncbi:DUF4169 family protein [Flagellatimonas centrodinii]|uniref:DUF4169 family protein n=1 Tax=Flagellatimonas centrodinii TaxID=2806210 RepID=UPI001FF03586|nr:DUF4169 family protein [Flagellatimonas centrodinii]ULQ48064.1 DUF4169 family protein [Flagellatimonas centrodinii]
MADLLNFNRARKRKARATAERQAAENRIRFGRTPAEKQREEDAQALAERQLQQHRREPDDR